MGKISMFFFRSKLGLINDLLATAERLDFFEYLLDRVTEENRKLTVQIELYDELMRDQQREIDRLHANARLNAQFGSGLDFPNSKER